MTRPTSTSEPWFGPAHRSYAEQVLGLEPVFAEARDAAVLDLGCAEGDIAATMATHHGAAMVHGAEIMVSRVELARRKWPDVPGSFFSCDLEHFSQFYDVNRDLLLAHYDIVLCLSVAHKLKRPELLLHSARNLARNLLAVRVPEKTFRDARSNRRPIDVQAEIGKGFRLEAEPPTCRGEWLGIFRRVA